METIVEEPKLAPPGAGLPKPELLIARILFARRLKSGSRDKFIALFQQQRQNIRDLIASRSPDSLTERVLIDRIRGLEDSSRFWSIAMTLEHLRIVHTGIARAITDLGNDRLPPGKVSTAAVKPDPNVTATVIPDYEKSCDQLLTAAESISNLKTKQRYAHPWFGPLDALGWLCLASGHHRIHREQIEHIIAGK